MALTSPARRSRAAPRSACTRPKCFSIARTSSSGASRSFMCCIRLPPPARDGGRPPPSRPGTGSLGVEELLDRRAVDVRLGDDGAAGAVVLGDAGLLAVQV